ncbi:MAG: ABC transporter permease [Candidatus Acidiferrales bacterium]
MNENSSISEKLRQFRAWFLRFGGLFRKQRRDRELADEIESNLQLHIEDNLRRGMPQEEARRQAVLKFGGVESAKESYRDRRGIPFLDHLFQDVRYALRTFRRNPIFTLAIVATLALGIGVNVTMFSVVDALLFRMPDHVRAPEQLVDVSLQTSDLGEAGIFDCYPGYLRLAGNSRLLDVAAQSHMQMDFGRGTDAREIQSRMVSYTYFDLLGVQMAIGRPFSKDEDNPAAGAHVVVLSYAFWQQQFGGDPQILNREVWMGDYQFTVIGIAPKGFNGAGFTTFDAWLPIADEPLFYGGRGIFTNEGARWLDTIARPHPGVSLKQAEAEATGLYVHSGGAPGGTVLLTPHFDSRLETLSENSRISLWISGVAFVVLLIGCANVTNLFLVRATQRRQEMAVRLQLGASRARLIRQLLVESLLLSTVGGAAALIIAFWARTMAQRVLFPRDFYPGSFFNWRLLAIGICLTVLTGLASGFAPAWRLSRPVVMEALKSGGHGRLLVGSKLRSSLLVTQVALTLTLTIGAGLFIESLRNADSYDRGFEPGRVLLATMDLGREGYKPADVLAIYDHLSERARSLPQVESTAIATTIPMFGGMYTDVSVPPRVSGPDSVMVAKSAVTADYFSAFGVKILQGRGFLPTDRAGAEKVLIVNQALAHDFWPGESPIGKCLIFSGAKNVCTTVIGVVSDQIISLAAGHTFSRNTGSPAMNTADAYVPMDQYLSEEDPISPNGILIRTRGNTAVAARNVFLAMASVAPGSRYVNVRPFSELFNYQTRTWRLGASMFGFFGSLALLLSTVGIYGVLAFLVRQRTNEIGIRMALGAMPQNILRLIVWQGMKFVLLGLAIGIGAALGLSRLMASMLFEVKPTNAASYVVACGVLVFVALVACLLPAWRAARVDPSTSLRYE